MKSFKIYSNIILFIFELLINLRNNEALEVNRFTLYDNCIQNSFSIEGITQDLIYEINNLSCFNLNCGPRFSSYRVYFHNEHYPVIIVVEVKLIKVINPPDTHVTIKLGRVIHGLEQLVGMYIVETQITPSSALHECYLTGIKQLKAKQTISLGQYINQTCLSNEMNFPDLANLVGDKVLYCMGEQITKFDEPVTNPHSIENGISNTKMLTNVLKIDDLDYYMNIPKRSCMIKSLKLNFNYEKQLSCDSDFVSVPTVLNYTAVPFNNSGYFNLSVEVIYQHRFNMFNLNVFLFFGQILENNSKTNQYFIAVSTFSPVERIHCLTEPYLESIEGSAKILITNLAKIKDYFNTIRDIKSLEEIFTNFPDSTLFCGSTKYKYTPGLSDGSIICATC